MLKKKIHIFILKNAFKWLNKLCNLKHVDNLINCHILSWKRFFKSSLEENCQNKKGNACAHFTI